MEDDEEPCTPCTPLDVFGHGPGPLPVFASAKLPPPTPARKRTPGKGMPSCLSRQSSLADTKLLVSTQLRRVGSKNLDSPNEFLFEAHFDFLQVIGRSAQAEVWLARSKESGNTYAVKKCLKSFHSRSDRQQYVHEVQAVARLPEHPNVVKYYRGWQQDQHFFMQMEHCTHGSFESLCQRLPPGTLIDEGDVWSLASQVATGLAFIHEYDVLHLDVKPDNIFIDAQGTYKLGDFGLAWMPGQGKEAVQT